MGQKTNYESIKGFDDAWADLDHQFHTNGEHPTWKITCNKVARYLHNFNGGDAIFYIPPSPFGGEIENYNFFVAKAMWDWHAQTEKSVGIQAASPLSMLIILSANILKRPIVSSEANVKEETLVLKKDGLSLKSKRTDKSPSSKIKRLVKPNKNFTETFTH